MSVNISMERWLSERPRGSIVVPGQRVTSNDGAPRLGTLAATQP